MVASSRKATLHDVAKRAHVSVASVSNYLNDYPYRKPATRERIQQAIDELEAEGCRLIMFFCTGKFPETLTSRNIPLIYPCDILDRIVPLMTKKSNIICMTPSPLQLSQTEGKWSQYVDKVTSIAASPYGPWEHLEKAAQQVKDMDADLIVLDCIGYTQEMKRMFEEKTGKLVVLPRTLLARVVSELTDLKKRG